MRTMSDSNVKTVTVRVYNNKKQYYYNNITPEIYCIDIYVKQKNLAWDYYWDEKIYYNDMYCIDSWDEFIFPEEYFLYS